MKKYSKYHFPILLLLMAAGLVSVSCADEDLSNNANERNGVSFGVSDVQDAPDADLPSLTKSKEAYLTRSIDFNEAGTSDMCLEESTVPGVNPMKRTPQTRAWLKSTIDANFGAFACQNGSAGPDYFDNEQVTPSGQMLQPKRWDASASTLKFYAVYPYMDGTNAQQKLVYPTTGSLPYVEFEASTNIANQTDLMTAETDPINYTAPGGLPYVVPLKFYHALTAIRFGIGRNLSWNKTIKSIEFQGIYKAGHFDLATKAWSNQTGIQNFKLDNINVSTTGTLNTVIVKDGNTFLMVPQTLPSGAKIVITFADNSHITANIGGKTWVAGTTKTYMMTEKNSTWEYKFETTNPSIIAYNQTQSTPYTIKSYRRDPATNTVQPLKWKIIAYQESTDAGLTWSAESTQKPQWLTDLTTKNGNGGQSAESGRALVTTENMINRLELYNKVLRDATAKGSAGNYYDLSTHDFKGNATLRNTANSYLISAPGYYKIPLVYGNAIKNNATNESAYKTTNTGPNILQNFKDHNGNNIDNPWITLTNGGANAPDGAKIVWSDQSGIVELTSIGLEGTGDNAFVHFHVPQDKIKNGNAVIAVTKGGVVVWSWHLWFDHKEVLETIKCTNFDNIDYNFTKLPLGFAYRKWEGTTYDKPRIVRLKVEQEGAKMLSYINIRQDPGSVKNISSTIYQWGRKDALPGVETVSDGTFIKNGGEDMSFQNGIQHPEKFYQILNMYTALWEINPPAGYNYQNLWATDKAIVSINDHAKAKSIYDPCPVGFQVPAGDAFTWATTTGENASANANYNTIGYWDYGYNFNNKISNPDASIWFPDTGRRHYSTGNLESVSDGNMLHFSESSNWTNQVSNMQPSQCSSFFATFNFYNLSPKFGHRRSHGLSVRPVTE